MTATRDDEKIAELVHRFGAAGYGIWWMVLEAVAAQVDATTTKCSVTYPVSKWSHILSVRGSHVRHCLSQLALTYLVTVEWNGTDITVTIPNLLKYRDEYTKKSGHSPDSVRSKQQQQKHSSDTEAEQSASPSSPPFPDLPPATIFSEAGREMPNPEFLYVRDALSGAEERIRRARNPLAYQASLVTKLRKEWAKRAESNGAVH